MADQRTNAKDRIKRFYNIVEFLLQSYGTAIRPKKAEIKVIILPEFLENIP